MRTDVLKDFTQLCDFIVSSLLWQKIYSLQITPGKQNILELPRHIYFASFLFPPTPHPPNQKVPCNACNDLTTSGTTPPAPQEYAAGDVSVPSIGTNVASHINGSLTFGSPAPVAASCERRRAARGTSAAVALVVLAERPVRRLEPEPAVELSAW